MSNSNLKRKNDIMTKCRLLPNILTFFFNNKRRKNVDCGKIIIQHFFLNNKKGKKCRNLQNFYSTYFLNNKKRKNVDQKVQMLTFVKFLFDIFS